MPSTFLAGVARCDITPPIGIAQGNWSAQVHERAEGIDLPLLCTVLAASDGHEEVIIAEWDLLFPPAGEALVQARAKITELTGVPADHIRISCSHTHAGPSLSRPWFESGAEMIAPYVASLADRLAGACFRAHRSMQPARVAGGTGSCAVNSNRRLPWKPDRIMMAPNPDGFSDHEVGVIRIDAEDGRPLAILVNFAAHPTILAWDNRLISPDYPGTVRRTVEDLTGALSLFLQGAAGDQDTIRDFSCRPEDARWVGRQIGLEAVRVAEWIDTQPVIRRVSRHVESSWTMGVAERIADGAPDSRVRCASRTVLLPLAYREPPTNEELTHVKSLEDRLAELRGQGAAHEEIREANRLARRANMDVMMARMKSQGQHLPMEFQAIRLGPTALMAIPAEPFSAIGVEVKRRSPFPVTFFSGFSNGATAYLPTAEAHAEGGYELWMSPFAAAAAGITVSESAALLESIWEPLSR